MPVFPISLFLVFIIPNWEIPKTLPENKGLSAEKAQLGRFVRTKFTEITRDSAGSELEAYSDEDYDVNGRRRGQDYYNRRKRCKVLFNFTQYQRK